MVICRNCSYRWELSYPSLEFLKDIFLAAVTQSPLKQTSPLKIMTIAKFPFQGFSVPNSGTRAR